MAPPKLEPLDINSISSKFNYSTNPEAFLQAAAEAMSHKAGIRTPKIHVLKQDLNVGGEVFAHDQKNAAYVPSTGDIYVTDMLAKSLNAKQMTAVIGHEMGHKIATEYGDTPANENNQLADASLQSNDDVYQNGNISVSLRQQLMFGLMSLLVDALEDNAIEVQPGYIVMQNGDVVFDILNAMDTVTDIPDELAYDEDYTLDEGASYPETSHAATAREAEKAADIKGIELTGHPEWAISSLNAITTPETETVTADSDHPSNSERIGNIKSTFGV